MPLREIAGAFGGEPMEPCMPSQLLEKRSSAYGLLACVFTTEPDTDVVREFYTFDWDSVFGGNCPLESPDDYTAIAAENRSQFARMFLGPKKRVAPPYESTYRSGLRRMGGHYTEDVRRCYQDAGIQRDGSIKEPDDFVGFELQFACCLLAAASLAVEMGDEVSFAESMQRYEDFLRYHLICWIPAFCDDILYSDPKPFLGLCAEILRRMVVREAENL